MADLRDARHLLDQLPPRRRAEVAAVIDASQVSILPRATVGCAVPNGYRVQIETWGMLVPDTARGAVRAKKLERFGEELRRAWGRDLRESAIALASPDPLIPPAWAWRCSRLLRDALAIARITPDHLIQMLHEGPDPGSTRFDLTTDCAAATSRRAEVSVTLPSSGQRLRTSVKLGEFVEYREGGDHSHSTTRSELLIRRCAFASTISTSLPGRAVEVVLRHPLLRSDYTIAGATKAGGCTRVRFTMPEINLARLPQSVAALLGTRARSDLAGNPWG